MTAIKPSDRPVQNGDVAARVIDGVAYLMDPDARELHALNEIGTRIFALVDGRRTVAEIVAAIIDEYDVAEEVARRDVGAFLDQLLQKSLITV